MALTPEDYREIFRQHNEFMDEWHKRNRELRKQALAEKGIVMQESPKNKKDNFHGKCDHPNTMTDESAIVLYIITMVGGAIFNDRWLLWIFATVIFCKFITRHKK